VFGQKLISFPPFSAAIRKYFPDRDAVRSQLRLFYDRAIALLILANVTLVIFDLTYIKHRSSYLRLDRYYQTRTDSPQKDYLELVDRLKNTLEEQGLDSPDVDPLLAQLRQSGIEILIENPPFRVRDAYGTWAAIETRFTEHLETDDLREAIETFWSRDYFAAVGWENALEFFNLNIRYILTLYEPFLGYDLIKGIEPYRDSQNYMIAVTDLRAVLNYEGLNSPRVEPMLEQLRELSVEMIDRDFMMQAQDTLGILAHVKYRMIEHIFSRDPSSTEHLTPTLQFLYSIGVLDLLSPEVIWADKSSKDAFRTFWSVENLEREGWQSELAFFDEEISLLMQSMYFRHLGINGDFIDRFWLVDFPWLVIFWTIFMIEIWFIRSRNPTLTVGAAIRQLWHHLFLLIPITRLTRLIPAFIRLDRAKLPDMAPLRAQIRLKVIASFSDELIQVTVNQGINQLQSTVSGGTLRKAVFKSPQESKPETESEDDAAQLSAIAGRLLQVTACHVLPEVQPDLEAFLYYQVDRSVQQSAIAKRLQRIPLLRRLPDQITENLVTRITAIVTQQPKKSYEASQTKIPDPVAQELQQRLVTRFMDTLRSELQDNQTIEEVEVILVDWLEQAKINAAKTPPPKRKPALKPAAAPETKQILPGENLDKKRQD